MRLGWLEIKRRYSRTLLGPFWTTLSLGIFIFALGILWSKLWNQDERSFLPFLTAGMIAWLTLSSIVSEACSVFISAETLIKSLNFSYIILCLSLIWRNLIVMAHNLIILLIVAIYSGINLNINNLLLIPGLILICLNALWITTLLGILCSRYRDIQQIVVSLLSITMFLTPILWTADRIPESHRAFVKYNIIYHYVELIRAPLLGKQPDAFSWLIIIVATIIGWTITTALYVKYRNRIPFWL